VARGQVGGPFHAAYVQHIRVGGSEAADKFKRARETRAVVAVEYREDRKGRSSPQSYLCSSQSSSCVCASA
jgi:hypothetical protein